MTLNDQDEGDVILRLVLRSASSSVTKCTVRRGNTGGVLNWYPMVENSPSVCSTNEMRLNFYDLCLEIGPLQLKTVAGYSKETSVNKNVEGYTDICTMG